ncbi:MAG: hypothetical protein ABI426_07455 [Flavobacterium sp.]
MKHLKQTIKVLIISFFLISSSCSDKKTANNYITAQDKNSIAAPIKKLINQDFVVQPENVAECLLKSNSQLPYSKKIDITKVSYLTADCIIEGIGDLLCESKTLRYIPLPNFENKRVVLVPMDCGDFNYRFFMVTILKNKMLSSQYVEGEWYEPGKEKYKELTSFTIDEDYKISITKKSLKKGKIVSTEVADFVINSDGIFEKAQ